MKPKKQLSDRLSSGNLVPGTDNSMMSQREIIWVMSVIPAAPFSARGLSSSSALWRIDHACQSRARPMVLWRVEVTEKGGGRLFVWGQTQPWKMDGWWGRAFVWDRGLFWTSSSHFEPIIIRQTGPSVLQLFSFTYKSHERWDWRREYLKALCWLRISGVIMRLCDLWLLTPELLKIRKKSSKRAAEAHLCVVRALFQFKKHLFNSKKKPAGFFFSALTVIAGDLFSWFFFWHTLL